MEMTRRRFIKELLKAVSGVFAGVWFYTKKALPRRFTFARRLEKYPGPIKPLARIEQGGKLGG
jgi:hypothetical protein